MKFIVSGIRTRTVTTTIVEQVDGEIDITKQEVMRVTDCPKAVDGNSTYWYGEVEEALRDGASHTTTKDAEVVELDRAEHTRVEWEDMEVDW